MKKFITCLVALTMATLMLSGCGANDSTAKDEKKPETNVTDTKDTEGEKLKIAIVQPMEHPSLNQIYTTIVSELEAMDLPSGIEIIHQNANGDLSLLPSIMQEIVSADVDVIIPIATGAAQAAAAATTEIPIVFSAVSAPVEAGLITDMKAPDKNITGVSDAIAVEDIFELAKQLTPDVKTFGFVYNAGEINSVSCIERGKAYCTKNGIKYLEATVAGTADIQQAASSLVGEVDAFFTPIDNTVASAMATYLQVANEAGIPVYVGADSMVVDGGLATVGIDYTVLGKQTAAMVGKILNGEAISGIPVETMNEYAKMINMKTADSLGIKVPEEIKKDFVILGK